MFDLIGKRFDRLIVIKRTGTSKNGHPLWLCKCSCGNEKIIYGSNLQSGNTKSCGCLKIEKLTKHGHNTRTIISKIYRIWRAMIQRYADVNNKDYGGRGITICKRWIKFENFLEDMGEVPEGHQIDRIDNDKVYYKENCRWVTSKQNNRNKRDSRLISCNGKTQCIAAWVEETGISKHTIRWRLDHNWSSQKALTTPVRKRER